MNWIQQNKTLAAILGVMIAGFLGLGVWLYLSYSEYSETRDKWDNMSRQVSSLEKADVYPSAGNVQALDQKIADYRDKFLTLRKLLLDPKLQQEKKPISETEFQAKVKERAKAVKQKADASGLELPPNFALGFEEYSDTLPVNAELAAELNIHLDVMEKLVDTLADAGTKKLEMLERTKLPNEKGAKSAFPAPNAPPPKPPPGRRPAAAAPAPVAEKVLDRYTIKCIFSTDQGPLQTVMNSLSNPAKTPDFLAVRLMRVENEKTEAPSKAEIASASVAPETSTDSNVKLPPGTVPPAKPDARVIMGDELLKVYLEVDYIRFRQPSAEGAGAAPAAKS